MAKPALPTGPVITRTGEAIFEVISGEGTLAAVLGVVLITSDDLTPVRVVLVRAEMPAGAHDPVTRALAGRRIRVTGVMVNATTFSYHIIEFMPKKRVAA